MGSWPRIYRRRVSTRGGSKWSTSSTPGALEIGGRRGGCLWAFGSGLSNVIPHVSNLEDQERRRVPQGVEPLPILRCPLVGAEIVHRRAQRFLLDKSFEHATPRRTTRGPASGWSSHERLFSPRLLRNDPEDVDHRKIAWIISLHATPSNLVLWSCLV